MSDFRLHPKTRPAAVALTVNDLPRLLDFYQKLLGLRLHRRAEDGEFVVECYRATFASFAQVFNAKSPRRKDARR